MKTNPTVQCQKLGLLGGRVMDRQPDQQSCPCPAPRAASLVVLTLWLASRSGLITMLL